MTRPPTVTPTPLARTADAVETLLVYPPCKSRTPAPSSSGRAVFFAVLSLSCVKLTNNQYPVGYSDVAFADLPPLCGEGLL